MSARAALAAARSAGICISLDGGHLQLDAEQTPPDDVVRLLAEHKPSIVELLRFEATAWTSEDWKAHHDERAAIYEFDAHTPRPEAEERAFMDCVVEWQKRHPVHSAPGWCLLGGGAGGVALFGAGKPRLAACDLCR